MLCECVKNIAVLSSLAMVLFSGKLFLTQRKTKYYAMFWIGELARVYGKLTEVIGRDKPPLFACIGYTVEYICSATSNSSVTLRLNCNDFGGVTVLFYKNDGFPHRISGYYNVTLVSSTPVITTRTEVTAIFALNGSKVTCEESSNGITYSLIGNGYFYVQG